MINLKLYKLFYIFKTTGWVLPVLPMFWLSYRHLALNQYLSLVSIFSILSFVIDYPISKLADRHNKKIVLMFGTV